MLDQIDSLKAALSDEKAARAKESETAATREQEAVANATKAAEGRADKLQALLEATDKKLGAVAKHLARLDNIDVKDVVRLTCVDTASYVSDDGSKCLSCAKPGSHFFNKGLGVNGLCQKCGRDPARWLNKGVCTVATTCKTGFYIKTKSNATADTVCAKYTVCKSGQWYEKPADGKDRVCIDHSPACRSHEKQAQAASPTQDRTCTPPWWATSCSAIHTKLAGTRSQDGWYSIAKYFDLKKAGDRTQGAYRVQGARWTNDNCGDGGKIHWGGGELTPQFDMGATAYLREITWQSVYQGGARGCQWQIQAKNDGGSWGHIGTFDFRTYSESIENSGLGRWRFGAKFNNYHGGQCAKYSGSYVYKHEGGTPYRYYRLRRGGVTRGHCPRVSALHWTGYKKDVKPTFYRAYCDMKKGGWQLACVTCLPPPPPGCRGTVTRPTPTLTPLSTLELWTSAAFHHGRTLCRAVCTAPARRPPLARPPPRRSPPSRVGCFVCLWFRGGGGARTGTTGTTSSSRRTTWSKSVS